MQDQQIDLLKADFRNFLFYVWKHLGLPPPTEIQYDIALYLQHGVRRRIIEAFRGVGKSWITAAYVLWRLFKNPNERVLVVSASSGRADSFSVFVKRLIEEIPLLNYLRPREGQRDSNLAFDVGPSTPHQSPSVRSVGITGQLTGGRASIIIADDVEVPKNTMTQLQRDRLAELVKEFDAILMSPEDLRVVGMDTSEVIYLGTPQCEMSLYNQLPQRGYEMRVWPARYPKADAVMRHGDRLAPLIKQKLVDQPDLAIDCSGRGAPTDPARFGDMDLLERESSYGRSGAALQFMLDTTISDADRFPLKIADLIAMALDRKMGPVSLAWGSGSHQVLNDVPNVGLSGDRWHAPMFVSKEFLPWQGVVMALDPSGRGGDELGYAIVAMLNGWLYVLACGGLKGGYADENLEKLSLLAKDYGVRHIIVEENFGDGMFSKLLTPFLVKNYPCTMEELKHSIQKEKRIIDTLEPVMNQHRLVIDAALINSDAENYNGYPDEHANRYQLFHQMTRITKDRGALAKDDRLDVLAMAVAYWVESMDADTNKADAKHKEETLDAALKEFMGQVLGGPPPQDCFVSFTH